MDFFRISMILSICVFLPSHGHYREAEEEGWSASPMKEVISKRTTTTQHKMKDAPVLTGSNVCQRIKCDFRNGLCNWIGGATMAINFKAYSPNPRVTVVGNADSGVNAKAFGAPLRNLDIGSDVITDGFAAVIHEPGQRAAMILPGLVVPKDLELNFKMYEACNDHVLAVCFGEGKCVDVSNPSVSRSDRRWKNGKVRIPAGTTEVLITANNFGNKHCSTGIRDFTVTDPVTGEKNCCAHSTVSPVTAPVISIPPPQDFGKLIDSWLDWLMHRTG